MSPLTPTQFGIAIGTVLAISWAWLGFGWMLLVALGIVIGAVVGRVVERRLDLSELVSAVTGKRSSS